MQIVSKPDNAPRAPSVPDYRLIQFIGKGAYGEVWRAVESLRERAVALKILRKSGEWDPSALSRELDGLRAYKQKLADHPGLVQVLHAGETDECVYYTMELADPFEDILDAKPETYCPFTLAALLERDVQLPVDRALEIIETLLEGLRHLHGYGVAHRDVKPVNVLFFSGHAKLADPGLVASLDRPSGRIGTPGYMPPDGAMGVSADLYAAGVLLYSMVTGLHATQFPELPSRRPNLPQDWRAMTAVVRIANQAAHPDPSRRYPTAAAMLRDVHYARRKIAVKSAPFARVAIGVLLLLGIATAVRMVCSPASPMMTNSAATAPASGKAWFDSRAARLVDSGWLINISFSDGHTTKTIQQRLPDQASGLCCIEDDAGRWRLAVGFEGSTRSSGELMFFDPFEMFKTREAKPLGPPLQLDRTPPLQWKVSPSDINHVFPVLSDDLDGDEKKELIVFVNNLNGPCRVVVLSHDLKEQYEYWHHGWLNGARAVTLPGDEHKHLICWGVANVSDSHMLDPPTGLQGCVLLLNPTDASQTGGRWGREDTMKDDSRRAPSAYGVIMKGTDGTHGDDWTITMIEPDASPIGAANSFAIRLKTGVTIKVRGDLCGLGSCWSDSRAHTEGPPPLESVWQHLFPIGACSPTSDASRSRSEP